MLLFLFGTDYTGDDKRQVEASKSQAQGGGGGTGTGVNEFVKQS